MYQHYYIKKMCLLSLRTNYQKKICATFSSNLCFKIFSTGTDNKTGTGISESDWNIFKILSSGTDNRTGISDQIGIFLSLVTVRTRWPPVAG